MVNYDRQSLYASKSAQSGTSSSGDVSSISGGASSAKTELVLTDENITVNGVSGNTRSSLSHKGFTTAGTVILGPSTLSSSAFALAVPVVDPTIDPVAEPLVVNYSAYTTIVLTREARSMNRSFLNSFANALR